MASCENFVFSYADSKEVTPDSCQTKLNELTKLINTAVGLITEFTANRHKVAGRTFTYEGIDLAAPQNLHVVVCSMLLQKLNQLNVSEMLVSQV